MTTTISKVQSYPSARTAQARWAMSPARKRGMRMHVFPHSENGRRRSAMREEPDHRGFKEIPTNIFVAR